MSRQTFQRQRDVFTVQAEGRLTKSEWPLTDFALQVAETGTVTSWTVILKGSLDGINFDTIVTHTKAANGSGHIIWPSGIRYPCFYVKAECTAIALGAGTGIISTWVGIEP